MSSTFSNIISLTKLKLICILLSLASTVTSSYHNVKIDKNGVFFTNPCNTEALNNFFPEIKIESDIPAQDGSEEILNVCSNLKHTCCNNEQIQTLANQLKHSLTYMDYRYTLNEKLFKKVDQIAPETYKVFLNELSEEDIKCYNDRQLVKYEEKEKRFLDSPHLLKILQSNKDQINFNPIKTMRYFINLKNEIDTYLEAVKKTYRVREEYYSGFVCSMCSPDFSTQFKLNKNNKFELEVNKYMCREIIENKIELVNTLYIYKYLQDLIDLTFCVKNNSKNSRNYGDFTWDDINLLGFDLETFPGYISKRRQCLIDENSFISRKNNDIDCKEICKGGLDLFKIPMTSMDKAIRIENDLDLIFFKFGSTESPAQRFEKNIQKYYKIRESEIQNGTIIFNKEKNFEIVNILKEQPDAKINFKQIDISVNSFIGLNVRSFVMNIDSYKNLQILLTGVIGLFFILCADKF